MSSLTPYRKKGLILILIMSAVATVVGSIALFGTYRAAMEQQRERLVETAQSWARLIEAVARFDRQYSETDIPGGHFEATLSQIRDAHRRFKGFGKSGEFTLARREGGRIVFLLSHRHYDLDHPEPLPFDDSALAQPMRAALQGRSGTMIGTDYRKATVLAAYEPVAELGAGVVAKIDLAEIRAPFIQAALWSGGIGMGLILLGTYLFLRVGAPLVQRLEESEHDLRIWENAFALSGNGMLITDIRLPDNPIVSVNPAFERITGYRAEEVIGRSYRFLQGDDQGQARELAQLRQAIDKGLNCQVILRNHRKDGTTFWNQLSISPVKDHRGNITHFLGIQEDITERKKLEDELKELATHDTLTGLFNRAEIERLAALEIGRSKRYRRRLGMLLIDIDRFKRINDSWGHPTGDLALMRLAKTLWDTLRENDLAGRYGGEEFLVLLPESGTEETRQLAERLLRTVREQPMDVGIGEDIQLTISIGLAVYPDNGATRDALITLADQALYAAKRAGRNRVHSA